MGCDIHIALEIKKDGKWKGIPEVIKSWDCRSYVLFGALAGVRSTINPSFIPKGLPKDISTEIFGPGKDGFILNEDSSLPDYWIPCSEEELEEHRDVETEIAEIGLILKYRANKIDIIYKDGEIKKGFTDPEEIIKENDNYRYYKDGYGYRVDFSCVDYHTPSYLSYSELCNKNIIRRWCSTCIKNLNNMNKELKDFQIFCAAVPFPNKIGDEISNLYDYDYENLLSTYLSGLREFEKISKEYNITNKKNIRIIFAFDN